MSAATISPPIACPPWCATTEHEWGEGAGLWPVIAHEVKFTNDVVSVLVYVEDEMSPTGAVRGAPVVSVDIDPTVCHSLSPEQAVLLMNALSDAASAAVSAVSAVSGKLTDPPTTP